MAPRPSRVYTLVHSVEQPGHPRGAVADAGGPGRRDGGGGFATALAGHSRVRAAERQCRVERGISGFFDGQLPRADLGSGYIAAQVGYVVVAWIADAAAVYRLLAVRRMRVGPRSG